MIGPRKLVLIGSARYGYAEIDLDKPIHIVAGNNMGKTSIINALQFLYVDDERAMHFGENDRLSTRRHYFGQEPGLILFECQGPRRRMLVGARGLGAVEGFGFERWCCDGEYDRTMFLQEDGMPRPWKDVRSDLATFRNYTTLKPKELRQALTGTGTAPNLGLVPLRANVDFDLFRGRFIDILRLTHIKGDDLKDSIIGICKGEGTFQEEIDLLGSYQETYHAARRDRNAAADFEVLLPTVTSLSQDLARHRDTIPGLVREWRSLNRSQQEQMTAIADQIQNTRRMISGIDARTKEAETAYVRAREEDNRIAASRAVLRKQISDIEDKRTSLASHDMDEVERHEREAMAEASSLETALRDAGSEGLSSAARRAERAHRELEDVERAIAQLDRPVMLDWLIERDFSRDEIEALSKVVNPRILTLEQDREFAVEDASALESHIRSVLARIEEDRLLAPAYEIDLSGIRPTATDRPDRSSLESDLKQRQAAASAADASLLAARERDRVEKDLRETNAERRRLSDLLSALRQLQVDAATLPDLHMKLDRAERDHVSAAAALEAANYQRTAVSQQGDRLERDLREAESARSTLMVALRNLSNTEDDRVEGDAGDISPEHFQDRLRAYRTRRANLEDQRAGIAQAHAVLIRHLHTLPADPDQMAEALEEAEVEWRAKIESAGKAWKTLLGGLTTSIRHLKEAYATVDRRVAALNHDLRDVKVSDLQRIRFRVEPKRSDLDMLDEFLATRASEDDMFLDRQAQADADARIEAMLKRGRLRIVDMFTLGVEVDRHGVTTPYSSLDKIESNGTGITIKIVMGLLILKSLLRIEGQRIPYYIDETGTLDDDNLREIIEFGLKKGFVAILASPDPKSSTSVHYFPQKHEGRSWIMPEHRIERVTPPDQAGAAT